MAPSPAAPTGRSTRSSARSSARALRRQRRRRIAIAFCASAAVVAMVAVAGVLLRPDDGPERSAPTTRETASTLPAPTTTTVPSTEPALLATLGVPTTAEATGASLAKVEVGLRSENRDATTLKQLGREQQLDYIALANHADWVPTALAAVPANVRAAVQATVDAAAAINKLGGTAPTTLPSNLQILVPPSADLMRGYYAEAEKASGIPWAYLAAIHFVESRMGRTHFDSTAGAQGPMQFLPSTWTSYGKGGDINDNHDAILAAGRFLADNGGAANIDKALFAYNHDNGYVAAMKGYAQVMLADAKAYDGYYQWQVLYPTAAGTYLLPEGYGVKSK